MRVALLGPPGAGKGTQARLLAAPRGWRVVVAGDIVRRLIADGTPMGRRIKGIVELGGLLPDEMVSEIVMHRLSHDDCQEGVVLDGFPRTVGQAESLEEFFTEHGQSLDHALELRVDDRLLIDRISGRFSCRNCGEGYHDRYRRPKKTGICDVCNETDFTRRKDDHPEVIRSRLEQYHQLTRPLLPYYRKRGLLRVVDGQNGTAHEVAARVAPLLGLEYTLSEDTL